MSILAEPRRRQKISIDPQNLEWKNNEQTFSKKLMKKMGWNDGDGLGRNRQGNSEHVKLKANYSGKGLGADKIASYDSTWIGHHDDFADLLSALNKNKEVIAKNDDSVEKEVQKISMELKSKSIRRRIHYQKFTRAKDSANYTDNDKSAILGLGLKRKKEESSDSEKEKEPEESSKFETDTKHTVSNVSVADYFAAKMAAFKAKQVNNNIEVKTEVCDENITDKVIKQEVEDTEDIVKKEIKEEVEDPEETERLRKERKAAKKLAKLARKQQEAAEAESEEKKSDEEPMEKEKKKKRSREIKEEVQEEEEIPVKKSKKDKKSKKADQE